MAEEFRVDDPSTTALKNEDLLSWPPI